MLVIVPVVDIFYFMSFAIKMLVRINTKMFVRTWIALVVVVPVIGIFDVTRHGVRSRAMLDLACSEVRQRQ